MPREPWTSSSKRGEGGGLPSRRWGIRDTKPDGQVKLGREGGSCTEGRGVVISMTGGVEGPEREANLRLEPGLYPSQSLMADIDYVSITAS